MVNLNEKIESIYFNRIRSHIKEKESEQVIFGACSNIIRGVLNKNNLNSETYMNFSALFRMSELKIQQRNIFAISVYTLAHPNIDFIFQKFQYLGEDDFWHDFDLDIIYTSNRDNDFYHPVTQVNITKQEFNDVVLPYFVLSDELLKLLRTDE